MALKLTVRFTDRQFLRCARISGKWVGEEASTAYFPFIPDQPFRVKMFLGFVLFFFLICVCDVFVFPQQVVPVTNVCETVLASVEALLILGVPVP